MVLVGDPQQLQAIEAGAAFRSIHERHGGVEIETVRRQHEDWQMDATRDLATGRTREAIHAYDSHDMVHQAQTREQTRDDLIETWDRDRQASPDASRIILTHTNAEVRALNDAARERMREASDLGEDVRVTVERGERSFAAGDRVMFLKNQRGLGVKNGTLGTIEDVSTQSMTVRTDDGRSIAFDLKDYDRIDHGYAATIHKAQGMTVDRTHVLATPGMDAHGSYVALSRHRDGMDLHYGRDDFASQDKLINTLSRDRAKDMATDYEQIDPAQEYAERRGITFRACVAEIMRKIVPERVRNAVDGMLDGLRKPGDGVPGHDAGQRPERGRAGVEASPAPDRPGRENAGAQTPHETADDPEEALRKVRTKALIRHARAVDAILEVKGQGLTPSDEQRRELGVARRAFDEVRPHGWQDAEAAYSKDNSLAYEAGSGVTGRAVRALYQETELRMERGELAQRADRFVERWQKLDRAVDQKYAAGDYSGYHAARNEMGNMAKSLERDPQLESILENRKRELGIDLESGRSLGRALAFTHGIDLGRGRGIGL